ncbi:MAG: iron ABC transporter permease [Actinobacteria bacterium]|nr:iron ABC transporter permease [Actinomycetota bacterium]MDI6830979.1 iron ABC transporter permease [Actinomycetota bacterium]
MAALVAATLALGVFAMTLGSADVSPLQVLRALTGQADQRTAQIVIHIRLVRVLAAVVAGIGLSVAGCVMQGVLLNPLASDYTLGVSQGAAFGAALAIVAMGAGSVQSTGADAVLIRNPYLVTVAAFAGAISATLAVLLLARYKGISPEAMVLAGIAFGSLFSAGTVITQYFASDVQVASIVFWTFGDIGRASWQELGIMSAITLPAAAYFILNRWNYNALVSGDDTARSLGVDVARTRMAGMFLASLITAVAVSFLGIIAFVGLVSPHLVRRAIGSDYRFLLPGACAMGALLLLASDTLSRTVVAPVVLPVGAITSFMGAPLFLYLLAKGYRRA